MFNLSWLLNIFAGFILLLLLLILLVPFIGLVYSIVIVPLTGRKR